MRHLCAAPIWCSRAHPILPSIGYAIISRNKVGKNKWETIYTGYKPDMKCIPGTMVLDASAAVDGVAQLSPWRVQAEVPKVDYSNLTIIAVPGFDKEGRESNFYKFNKNRVRMAAFARGIITKYLNPGDKVLVACKQALIPEFTDWRPSDERYKASEYRNGGDAGYLVDVDGIRCAVTHYGDGVGSNDWKEASTVVLLDNFWIPKREAIAKALGLLRKPAEGQGLSKSLATNHPAVIAVLEGHALRQILQMTGRGMVRNLHHSGRCGPMTVIYSGDIDLLRDNLQAMFHGAKLDDRTGWKPRNITQRMLALLDGTPVDVLELTGERAWHGSKACASPTVGPAGDTGTDEDMEADTAPRAQLLGVWEDDPVGIGIFVVAPWSRNDPVNRSIAPRCVTCPALCFASGPAGPFFGRLPRLTFS